MFARQRKKTKRKWKEGEEKVINLKLRLKNKTTLAAIVAAVVACAYQILAALGITPPIDQSVILTIANTIISGLVLLGIVVDPTTPGIHDSNRAMTYDIPGENLDEYNKPADERGE